MLKYVIAAGLAGTMLLPVASSAAVEYVRVCAAQGAGWNYIPGTETCVNQQTGETKRITENGTVEGTTDAIKGVALSLAMPNATIDEGKSFGAAVNIGTFGGATAIGIGGAFRATDGLTVNGAVGGSLDGGPIGGRAGVNFSW